MNLDVRSWLYLKRPLYFQLIFFLRYVHIFFIQSDIYLYMYMQSVIHYIILVFSNQHYYLHDWFRGGSRIVSEWGSVWVIYRIYSVYSDGQAWANSVDRSDAAFCMVYTVCHSPSNFTHFHRLENGFLEKKKYKVKSRGYEYFVYFKSKGKEGAVTATYFVDARRHFFANF